MPFLSLPDQLDTLPLSFSLFQVVTTYPDQRRFPILIIVVGCFRCSSMYVHTFFFNLSRQFFVVFGVVVHVAAYKMLEYMARPYLGPGGELLEAGTDLSDSYFSE